jgi:threonine dehydratase
MVDVSPRPTAAVPAELTAASLRDTWAVLDGQVMPTLLLHSQALDEAVGAQVTLACETFQRTGSFKFRGASNLIRNVPNLRIVSASSGNFGQAVALASRLAGKTCTVVMPDTSSRVKIEAVRRNGATVDLVDTRAVSRMDRVHQLLAEDATQFYAPAFDDVRVVAGNSSLGREIFESGVELDAVVVPVGGGGLISGIVAARDALAQPTPIVGAEPLLANDAARSMKLGTIVANESEPPTIADGARTLSLGEVTWPIVRNGVEQIVEAPEAMIAEAVRLLFRYANVKAEPTGALALAAVAARPERFRGRRVCCVVSGGNVDEEVYAAILRQEL